MSQLYFIPTWFFGYDVALEILFGVIALLVAYYSYKIYRLTAQREPKIFSFAFLLIALSYFAWSALNLYLVDELNEGTRVLNLDVISAFSAVGIAIYMVLLVAGLVTLFYMTTKIKSGRTYGVLLFLSLFAILFASDAALALYLVSSLLLVFITIYYIYEYKKNRNKKTLSVLIAFAILLIANFDFSVGHGSEVQYVVIHFMEFVAFLIILGNVLSVVNHGGKKKK